MENTTFKNKTILDISIVIIFLKVIFTKFPYIYGPKVAKMVKSSLDNKHFDYIKKIIK
jgi:hypothetical protein